MTVLKSIIHLFVNSEQFLSFPDYEQYINEGIKLPALVCVITGNSSHYNFLFSANRDDFIFTFVLC